MAKETFKIEIPVSVTDNTDPGVSQSKSKMSAFDKVVEKAQSRLDKMNSTKWKVAIETVDKVTSVISTIGTSVKNVTGKVWSVTLSAVDKVTSVAKGIISTLGKVLSIGTMVSTVLGGLTVADALEAAQTQTTVETQLKTVLQNMAENAEEVESIYDRITAKASALQQATIYGNETYIAGAAELATYFTDADAIETMMDTLANYAAGMSGGAELTTDELVDYATNLGKIMTGSYDAMTKKGFEFSDAQKAIIEGTATEEQLTEALGDEWRNMSEEMQAAQVISDIINESWDGLAETLADLPAAKVTQFKNAWGDVKEVIGNKLYPAVGDFFSMLSEKLPAAQELLEGGSDWLANAFEELIPSISEAIDGAIEKAEELAKTIKEMTESEEWQGADLFGKVKIAWDTLIAEPFSEWWDSTGKQFFVDKASSIGESIGSGITSGLLALLGIDVDDAAEDGTSVGGAFLQGFKDGFDTSAIGDAITEWAEEHKEIVVAAGAVVGFNLITGLASKISSITSLFTGSGSSGSSTTTASTVTVNGAVVNVYGSTSSAASTATSAVKALPSGGTGSTVAGALTGGGIGSTIVGGLASVGTALGSGAATTGGLAAAGATGIGGILGGIAGLVSAGVDVYQGYKASKEGDSKTAKTEYATA
ncbi:MAG: hypothetical protein LUE24_02975, partial [Lachnospiraceae bacterium]|nr:hypothetical protein [Lachnospiraceae bacterium]